MNFRSALNIAFLSPPNWPVNPPDYYDTKAEARARFVESRREEIADDLIEIADALQQYMVQKPAQFAMTFKKACGGTLQAAIDLQELLDKAVDCYIEKEWSGK